MRLRMARRLEAEVERANAALCVAELATTERERAPRRNLLYRPDCMQRLSGVATKVGRACRPCIGPRPGGRLHIERAFADPSSHYLQCQVPWLLAED